MRTFHREKEPDTATLGQRRRLVLLWAMLGIVVGWAGWHPVAIIFAGSAKAAVGTVQEWTWPMFVALSAAAFGAIPLGGMIRRCPENGEGDSKLLLRSALVGALAFGLSVVAGKLVFEALKASWHHWHDGVMEWFVLAVPLCVFLAVLFSAVFHRTLQSVRTHLSL